jgi:hypothetical protein
MSSTRVAFAAGYWPGPRREKLYPRLVAEGNVSLVGRAGVICNTAGTVRSVERAGVCARVLGDVKTVSVRHWERCRTTVAARLDALSWRVRRLARSGREVADGVARFRRMRCLAAAMPENEEHFLRFTSQEPRTR